MKPKDSQLIIALLVALLLILSVFTFVAAMRYKEMEHAIEISIEDRAQMRKMMDAMQKDSSVRPTPPESK